MQVTHGFLIDSVPLRLAYGAANGQDSAEVPADSR
jgi:hypothetical protein